MEFFGAFVSSILSTIVYIVIFMGVYKLYYIAKDVHQIKELMERKLRNADGAPVEARAVPVAPPAAMPQVSASLSEEDTASAYAEQLLRAVNAGPAKETQEVR